MKQNLVLEVSLSNYMTLPGSTRATSPLAETKGDFGALPDSQARHILPELGSLYHAPSSYAKVDCSDNVAVYCSQSDQGRRQVDLLPRSVDSGLGQGLLQLGDRVSGHFLGGQNSLSIVEPATEWRGHGEQGDQVLK